MKDITKAWYNLSTRIVGERASREMIYEDDDHEDGRKMIEW